MTTPIPLAHHTVSRRWVLSGLSAAAISTGLSACGSNSSDSSSSATSTASGSTTTSGSSATVDGAAAAGSVAALAQAFYATLDADQQQTVLLDYTFASAVRWSNLPQSLLTGGIGGGGLPSGAPSGAPSGDPDGGSFPTGAAPSGAGDPGGGSDQSRVGLSIGGLTDDQVAALTAMLKAATGTKPGLGYDEITQQLLADDYLEANGGGDDYGRANYFIALLGSPQDTGTWELQFGGHHLAVANTYTDGALTGATPSFRGVEPNGKFEQDGQTGQPMAVKETAFVDLLAGLPADALAAAQLSDVYTDLVLGPGDDWAFPERREGVQVSSLTAPTKALVLAAIGTYVDDVADSDADAILARYGDELDDTYVAYSGSTALTEENDYVRIDGPSVWIEFSLQHGIVLEGNHPHSVWRDRTTDYGGTRS